jgi:hypothetical protein
MRKSLMCLRLTAIGLVVGAMNVAWGGRQLSRPSRFSAALSNRRTVHV